MVRALTESTALINFALVKDHSICGYTGALKNMTHGCNVNPQDFHDHHASPQIALLAAQDVLRSRLRLCIIDGFKLMAHGGTALQAARSTSSPTRRCTFRPIPSRSTRSGGARSRRRAPAST